MKYLLFVIICMALFSCGTQKQATYPYEERNQEIPPNPLITESLFNDKSATISEENIQKILNSDYKIPAKLRVAIIKLDDRKRNLFWNDEDYIKNEQSNLSILTNLLKASPRVTTVSVVPELMISKPLSITNLREAGVRMQADVIIIFSSITDTYLNIKSFQRQTLKPLQLHRLYCLIQELPWFPSLMCQPKIFFHKKTPMN